MHTFTSEQDKILSLLLATKIYTNIICLKSGSWARPENQSLNKADLKRRLTYKQVWTKVFAKQIYANLGKENKF